MPTAAGVAASAAGVAGAGAKKGFVAISTLVFENPAGVKILSCIIGILLSVVSILSVFNVLGDDSWRAREILQCIYVFWFGILICVTDGKAEWVNKCWNLQDTLFHYFYFLATHPGRAGFYFYVGSITLLMLPRSNLMQFTYIILGGLLCILGTFMLLMRYCECCRLRGLISYLAASLKGPFKLKFDNQLRDMVAPVAEFIGRTEKVSDLNLPGAGLGQTSKAVATLARACGLNRSLKIINFSQNGLGSAGAQHVCQALWNHPTIERLNLSGNHIGMSGALHVGRMIRKNRCVTDLDLSENSIGTDGAEAIAESLFCNHSLRDINLRHNNIGQQGSRQLKVSTDLAMVSFRRVINLRDNREGCPQELSSTPATRRMSFESMEIKVQNQARIARSATTPFQRRKSW